MLRRTFLQRAFRALGLALGTANAASATAITTSSNNEGSRKFLASKDPSSSDTFLDPGEVQEVEKLAKRAELSEKSITPVSRIAFGSCAQQNDPQPIWDAIGESQPDLFVFLGDNIYADTEDMLEMERKYKQLGSKPQFVQFKSKVPVLATWDDHDYGINDGGAEYPKKQQSKDLMLDFFGEPKDSERRSREGVYASYNFGPTGQCVQLLLLDLRWFRSPLIYDKKVEGYVPNNSPDAVLLGEKQWTWLEEELKKKADLRIIGSSIQFASSDHIWEKWANYPREKQRIISCIDKLQAKNVLFISGDMHYGEISEEKSPEGFSIYDLTSSGMNFVEPGAQFPNRNRLKLFDKSPNFGFIELDWGPTETGFKLSVKDDKGKTVISHSGSFRRAV